MKIIKISAVFILIIAIFSAILYFMGSKSEPSLPPEEIDHYREKIDAKWRGVVWSDSIFENVKGYIGSQRSNLRGSYNTLMDYNSVTAIRHIYEALMGEFNKSNCSTEKVEEYYAGIKYLLKNDAEHTAKDDKILKMDHTYKLYNKVERFCNKNFIIKPAFDLYSTGFWEPQFRTYRKSITDELSNLKNNSYYPYIKNITRFKEGFNSTNTKLDNAELVYMDSVLDTVKSAMITNPEVCDSLKSIREHYREDFSRIISNNRTAQNKANTMNNLKCNN